MKYSLCLLAVSALAAAYPGKVPAPGPDGRYTLEAPGIRAQVFTILSYSHSHSLFILTDHYLQLASLGALSHYAELLHSIAIFLFLNTNQSSDSSFLMRPL
jgi:hypothetical protein